MARRIVQLVIIGSLLAAAAGCGQKGPLYLPGEDGDGADSTQTAD